MKPLTIGDAVEVKATASLEYSEDNKRYVCRTVRSPFIGYIVGQQTKQLGEYIRGSRIGWGEDYDPPTLRVTGTVTLWQVKTGMTNKILLVQDEDLEPCLAEAPVPRVGIKPQAIFSDYIDAINLEN